ARHEAQLLRLEPEPRVHELVRDRVREVEPAEEEARAERDRTAAEDELRREARRELAELAAQRGGDEHLLRVEAEGVGPVADLPEGPEMEEVLAEVEAHLARTVEEEARRSSEVATRSRDRGRDGVEGALDESEDTHGPIPFRCSLARRSASRFPYERCLSNF